MRSQEKKQKEWYPCQKMTDYSCVNLSMVRKFKEGCTVLNINFHCVLIFSIFAVVREAHIVMINVI